jgi:8-oxo-dGTP diphosphatase
MIVKDGKILMGKRKGSHAAGEYGLVGGHLDPMESFEDCIKREVREECGLEIDNLRFICVSNINTYAPKHYIDIDFIADWQSGEPKVLEPEKCEGWGWYSLGDLPKPLNYLTEVLLESLKNKNYFNDLGSNEF